MIRSLTVTNYLGEKLKVVLEEAEPAHGLLLTNITGIGPVDATINTSDFASNDGSEFNSSRLEKRTIQLTFQLTNNVISVEKARHIAYKAFPTKRYVELIFETDERTCYAYGYVEHNTPDIFKKDVSQSIDIVCEDPYFYKMENGIDDTAVDISSTEAKFHFEYDENEGDGVLYTPFETTSYVSAGDAVSEIDYEGETETGFIVSIYISGPIEGNIILSRYRTAERFLIDIEKLNAMIGSLSVGDEIIISTEQKHNYCKLIKDGNEINILNAVDIDNSTWLILYPGENYFVYSIDAGNDNSGATIKYKTRYLGV